VPLSSLAVIRLDPLRQQLQCQACGASVIFSANDDPRSPLHFIETHEQGGCVSAAAVSS
jgi:hypothetical protein